MFPRWLTYPTLGKPNLTSRPEREDPLPVFGDFATGSRETVLSPAQTINLFTYRFWLPHR